jgi:hypothetical protein
MLLTITSTHEQATDLGYLLHKNPDKVHMPLRARRQKPPCRRRSRRCLKLESTATSLSRCSISIASEKTPRTVMLKRIAVIAGLWNRWAI